MNESKSKIQLLLIVFLLSISLIGYSFEIGHTQAEYYDLLRDRYIEVEIYYPADIQGENTPIAQGSFPVIVFGHGYMMSWQSYENFWSELTPDGYIICFPTTEMGASPNHEYFGQDLNFIATKMQLENSNPSSLFYNSVLARTCIMGHSMGGGASFLAASNSNDITTLVNFAAAETDPSAIDAASEISIPSLIFSGADDCVTPPAQNQDLMYDNLASDCKTQISIIDGGHCYFADYDFLCTLGESSCNPTLNITRDQQQQTTFDFLNLWLRYSLYDDNSAFETFNDSLNNSSRIDYNQFCNTTGEREYHINSDMSVYPNPTRNFITITSDKINKMLVSIYKLSNQRVYFNSITSGNIDISALLPGLYILEINDGKNVHRQLIVKR